MREAAAREAADRVSVSAENAALAAEKAAAAALKASDAEKAAENAAEDLTAAEASKEGNAIQQRHLQRTARSLAKDAMDTAVALRAEAEKAEAAQVAGEEAVLRCLAAKKEERRKKTAAHRELAGLRRAEEDPNPKPNPNPNPNLQV